MQLIKETIHLPASYSANAEAEELRNALVLKSRQITAVKTSQQNTDAGANVRTMRLHVKGVEAARVELTKPLLDGQRLLKSLADDHCQPLKDEIARLEKLGTDFMEAEARRVAAAEAARAKAFTEAAAKRIAAEDAARKAAEKMTTAAGLAKAEKLEAKAIAVAEQVQTIIAAPLPETQRAKGQSMKQVLKWEVTDIRALAAARPDLVRMEPNAAGIQSTCIPEMPNLPPGLKLWWENKATYAARTPAMPSTITPLLENKPMEYIESQSSQISKFAHDADTNTLHVHFHSGGHYSYAGVDAAAFAAFRDAPSHGKHLGQHIKGKFQFTKHA